MKVPLKWSYHAKQRVAERLAHHAGGDARLVGAWLGRELVIAIADDRLSDAGPGWVNGRGLAQDGKVWAVVALDDSPIAVLLAECKNHWHVVTVITQDDVVAAA